MSQGVVFPLRANLNFGKGLTVTDNPTIDALDITPANYALNTIATSTNATTAIETYTLPDNAVTAVYVEVTGHQTAGTNSPDGAEYQLKGVWRRDGGAPVQIMAPTVVSSNPNANGAAWTAVLAISGNNVLVNVTGDTGKTITWTSTRTSFGG